MIESAFIHSQAQKDCYKELDVERFQFVATLDSHTSETCQAMDGVVIDMSDYKIGLNVPPLHCYCRSCVIPYYGDNVGMRAARGEDGKTYLVSSDMTYKDWKKTFVDGDTKELQEIGNSSTMKADTVIINGRDMSGEFTPSGAYEHLINDVIHQQGFDGKPKIVPYEVFKKKMEESNFYAERTYSASTQEVLESYRQELYGEHGTDWYLDCSTGGAQYGQGMYCAASYDIANNKSMGGIGWEMLHYQDVNIQRGNSLSYTEAITLDKTAKILELPNGATRNEAYEFITQKYLENYIKKFAVASQKEAVNMYIKTCDEISKLTYSESEEVIEALYNARAEYATEIESLLASAHEAMEDITDGKKYHGLKNPGVLAAEMGYDAINAVGHGESGSYTVILNRTKIIFCEGGSIYGN